MTCTVGIVPSREALLKPVIILFILSLVSCSSNLARDKKTIDGSQEKTTNTETASAQSGNQRTPTPSSSAGDEGRKWTMYLIDERDTKLFYDENGVTQSSKNIVQIWRKRDFSPEATQQQIVTLDEIDCLKGQYRTLVLRVTYWDGTTGRTDKPTRWMKILRSSGEAYLKGQYCQ
jgi:hypothetical protein